MPWLEVTKMSLKKEFVDLALLKTVPFSQLCERYKISRKTGYKLLKRYELHGDSGLLEQSKRPHSSPIKTDALLEAKVLKVREWKATWGGRKIRRWLQDQGEEEVPAASTITDILRRHGCLNQSERPSHSLIRFEHECPNDLWQMDFKGHFEIGRGRCYPLTLIDDHSRFSIGLKACPGEKADGVKNHLTEIFRRYGLPLRMNMDNGTPWATPKGVFRFTALTIWIMRLGIKVSYSRIRHPQTNGKNERFHRTLKSELLQFNYFKTLNEAQQKFDIWRDEYNGQRPHESLNFDTPIKHYQISKRPYPEHLEPIAYRDTDIIRKVDSSGKFSFKNKDYFISDALRGEYIAIRQTEDNLYKVFFCNQRIAIIDKLLKRG